MKKFFLSIVVVLAAVSPLLSKAQSDVQVATGNNHVLALKNGTLYGWGDNSEGQLGIGTKSIEYAPVQIGNNQEWKQIDASAMHSVAIKKDGTLWAWGWGNNHELGLGQTNSRSLVPARVGKDTNWAMVSTAFNNTVAIKTDGTLWVWGSNVQAALGVGATTNSAVYTPTKVGKENDWQSALSVQHIIFAIKKNGTLWVWGRKGGSDVRGLESSADVTNSPTRVGNESGWKQLFAFKQHGRASVIGIKEDGSIWAWGNNMSGKLGFGDDQFRPLPTRVPLKGQWQSFAMNTEYSLACHADGSLWQSGSYLKWTDAKAGEQNKSNVFLRSKIPGKWASVHFLQMSGVVLINDKGDIYTYGINARGELGNGTKTGSWKPVLVRL